jgi:hypothetical protein
MVPDLISLVGKNIELVFLKGFPGRHRDDSGKKGKSYQEKNNTDKKKAPKEPAFKNVHTLRLYTLF